MGNTEYDKASGINISTLKELWKKSPAHYQHRLSVPRKLTPSLVLGIQTHMAVFEPLRFEREIAMVPDGLTRRTKVGKAWYEEQDPELVIKPADYERCMAMRDAVAAHPEAAQWLDDDGGEAEKALFWTDEETGLKCKGRIDLLHGSGALVGLKTCNDARPAAFQRAGANYGYHLQWAYYFDGLCRLGKEPPCVIEIAVESVPPYGVVPYEIKTDTIEEGRIAYRNALARLAECAEMNHWPGISDGMVHFELPPWALSNTEDEALDGLDLDGVREES